MLVAIVSQFVLALVLVRHRTIFAQCVAKWGIAKMCLVRNSLKKYRAIWGIAAIALQHRAIWGRLVSGVGRFLVSGGFVLWGVVSALRLSGDPLKPTHPYRMSAGLRRGSL